MKTIYLAVALLTAASCASAQAIREVKYDPRNVININVARGVALAIVLPEGEQIRWAGTGKYSDCAKSEAPWCVNAPQGESILFVKARSNAEHSNNLELVTASRAYSFKLRVVSTENASVTQRLVVLSPPRPSGLLTISTPTEMPKSMAENGLVHGQSSLSTAIAIPRVTIATTSLSENKDEAQERRATQDPVPTIQNSAYSLAIGERSDDIIPSTVFDDGRFTYLRFAGNREIPSAFHVTAEGEESMVNTRMEKDFLVVDRVSRHLRLRLSNQVISVFNDNFDLEGTPPVNGTTIKGIERSLRLVDSNKALRGLQ